MSKKDIPEKSILERFPYIHTGRELELMLAKKKPLARFYDIESCLPNEDIVPEIQFSPHIKSGVLVRDEFELISGVSTADGVRHKIINVLFALPSEAWRMNAMRMLITQHNLTGQWNETCERIEGKLLGYTEEENETWCKWLRDNRAVF